jgi:Zn-finger nucleic acid-binding protein
MNNDSWDDRRRAQEEGYFARANKEALARLARKQEGPERPSPVTGKPMQPITVLGVVLDRCSESGGLWFDSGELEQVLAAMKDSTASLQDFLGTLPPLSADATVASEGLPSPINGSPMQHDKVLGIAVYRCSESGGIWIDARELDDLIKSSHQSLKSSVMDFFSMVLGRK